MEAPAYTPELRAPLTGKSSLGRRILPHSGMLLPGWQRQRHHGCCQALPPPVGEEGKDAVRARDPFKLQSRPSLRLGVASAPWTPPSLTARRPLTQGRETSLLVTQGKYLPSLDNRILKAAPTAWPSLCRHRGRDLWEHRSQTTGPGLGPGGG